MRKRKCCCWKLNIEFHYTYLLMALGFVLGGYYLNLIVFTSLILIHEMGHYIMARVNGFDVLKIVIYPYGGMTKINSLINEDINKELLVATSGIIFQYLFYIVIGILYSKGLIREYTYNLYTLYNSQIIFFNMLPIYPLDGAKVVNLVLQKYLYYNLSNMLIILISLIILIMLVVLNIYEYNYSNLIIYMILISYLYKFYKRRKYLYNKFLLERYLYSIKYPKIGIINNIYKMYKNKSHLINIGNTYKKESEVISNLFSKK